MFQTVSVLIIADDPLARAGLAALLAHTQTVEVVGQSGSDADLSAVVDAFRPDAIVWDLGWEPAGHTAALRQLIEERSLPVVALLSVESLGDTVRASGVRGMLLRTSSGDQIAAALVAVVQGLLVFDEVLLPVPATSSTDIELVEPLSGRELEVLHHLAEGLSNKEIARAIGISENTVKFHVNAILGKLGAQSRTEAVVRATRAGLILL